ncbi:hypothetical protein OSB04_009834 [Centaurea solstitialis]|uniref:HAT C-terminal dimerisation domain-containing protein n=1 Tax=Centaurea solstitialis TaxID=347529 RepID=A0AA38TI65_9ASTR|nr:hypothetical protein OSB04_009834 [Centaurea solstitialis]
MLASESTFSVSGRVIMQRRSRPTTESVECCICLKDFLDEAVRQQHMTSLDESFCGDVKTIIHNEEVDEGISPPSDDDDEDDE